MRVLVHPNGDLSVGDASDFLMRLPSTHPAFQYFRDLADRGEIERTAEGRGAEPYSRPTGQEMFDAMTPAEQDAQYGPEKAEALRTGKITLADLVQRSPLDEAPDFITERPLKDLL